MLYFAKYFRLSNSLLSYSSTVSSLWRGGKSCKEYSASWLTTLRSTVGFI